MKQEEKSRQSQERILRAAIAEFGEKGYDGASLNGLLSDNGLSKGLLYHYFPNKDQLYLGCVAVCLEALMSALEQVERGNGSAALLRSYFEARGRFLRENPRLERVFFDALLQPPPHLTQALAQTRAPFDAFNRTLYRDLLAGLQLRPGVSEEDALFYFDVMQRALHLQLGAQGGAYERRARQMVELLLYGLSGGEAL